MELSVAQEIYKTKPNKKEIDLAIKIEEETRFYTERFLQDDAPDFYHRDFLPWVQSRLNNNQSYNNFINAITHPVTTAQFVDDIYSKLARIWEAQNPFYKIDIKDSEEQLDLSWWKNTGWDLMKIRHNSIIFIDLPAKQEKDLPEPYINILPIEKTIDVDVKDNVINHIMFEYKGQIVVIDKDYYQKFDLNKDKTEIVAEAQEPKNPNILKYCPAFFLSNIKYRDKYEIPRINPLTNALGKFRNLLFLDTLKDITDPYAFYMFISKYNSSANCDFRDGEKYCVNGLLYTTVEGSETTEGYTQPVYDSGARDSIKKCPKCNKNLGYGQVVTLPIPTDSADKAIPTPIQFVSPPKDLLEWRNVYLKGLYNDLAAFVVGNDQELNPKMNHNETAYRYNIEGMQAILMRWKGVYEVAIKSTEDAKNTIKHGLNYTGSHIDLGSDFLLLDVQDLYDEKKSANELGLGTVLNFNDRIIETKYKTNPDLKLRAKIINAFKPFDEMMANVENSFVSKSISKLDYYKTKYLDQFVSWFEIEKGKIVEYGKNKGKKATIDLMNEAFNDFFAIKSKQIETSQKMLAEIIGVGGTQGMITILTDYKLTPTQKSALLQKLFNIDKIEADNMTAQEKIIEEPKEVAPPVVPPVIDPNV